jgi:hypothetical protein
MLEFVHSKVNETLIKAKRHENNRDKSFKVRITELEEFVNELNDQVKSVEKGMKEKQRQLRLPAFFQKETPRMMDFDEFCFPAKLTAFTKSHNLISKTQFKEKQMIPIMKDFVEKGLSHLKGHTELDRNPPKSVLDEL